MKDNTGSKNNGDKLRHLAEERLKELGIKKAIPRQDQDIHRLAAELQVQQMELEMQKEELQQAQLEAEADLERYTDLYDFAPVAYLTLDRDGNVLSVNLAGEKLLGVHRSQFMNDSLKSLISPETLSSFNAFLFKIFEYHSRETCKVVLLTGNGSKLWVQLDALISRDGEECSITIADITEHERVENTPQDSEDHIQKMLNGILSPEDNLGTLELSDIIDVNALQHLMDEFYELTRVPNAIIDLKGKVLVGTGWTDICTKFHRMHPETLANCIECDTVLSKDVERGTFKTYLCKNHLRDCVTPLFVGTQHVGNLFTGQFFFEGEKPDASVFKAQALKYGFNEEEYMEAFKKVPVWSRETIEVAFEFFVTLASMITSLSHSNIALARMLEERNRMEEDKRRFYRDTIKSVTQGKLDLVSREDVAEFLDPTKLISSVESVADTGIARSSIKAFRKLNGLLGEYATGDNEDSLDLFESAVGEALTNAVKHANGCQVYAGIKDMSIWVAVSDTGQGISTMLLPGATLRTGFSSKVSMGMGYTIMMEAADNIILCTDSEGTTVVLSVDVGSRVDRFLDGFHDTWDEIS